MHSLIVLKFGDPILRFCVLKLHPQAIWQTAEFDMVFESKNLETNWMRIFFPMLLTNWTVPPMLTIGTIKFTQVETFDLKVTRRKHLPWVVWRGFENDSQKRADFETVRDQSLMYRTVYAKKVISWVKDGLPLSLLIHCQSMQNRPETVINIWICPSTSNRLLLQNGRL